MKTEYKWILIEFITIVVGTFITVFNALDSWISQGDLAFGVSLVVLGVMIRLWRKEFFKS